MTTRVASGVHLTLPNNGQLAEGADHALYVRELSEFQSAVLRGDAYSFFASKDVDGGDTLLYVRNTNTIKELRIQRIIVSGVAAGLVEVGYSTPPTEAGTAVTPTNLNRKSNNTAQATCIEDQTGATTLYNVLEIHIGVGTPTVVEVNGAMVLGFDDCINVDVITDIAISSATIWGYFI